MADREKAPLPYNTQELGVHEGSGGHIYLTDANGRKIGVVWGARLEKPWTAEHLKIAANFHDRLVALLASIGELEFDSWIGYRTSEIDALLKEIEAAKEPDISGETNAEVSEKAGGD